MKLFMNVMTQASITLVAVSGIYVLTGLTGMFSMGQAAFMAIGGYTAGLLAKRLGFSMWLNIPCGIVVGMLFGFLIGLPVVKLRRDYVSIITILFGEAVIAFLNNAASLTGGALGLMNVPKETSKTMLIIILIIIVFFIANFKKSRFGRQCLAVKSDELAAAAMGINVVRIKLTAFMLAGAITSLAGVLWVHTTTYIDSSSFGWAQSSTWILYVFFGGVNSLTGSIFGGAVLGMLQELMRFSNELRVVFYCVLILLVVNFRSQGLFGTTELDWQTIKKIGKWISGKLGRKQNGKEGPGNAS